MTAPVARDRRIQEAGPPLTRRAFPHLEEGQWSRGRLVRALQDQGWWNVAEDVADGIPLEVIVERLDAIDEAESSAATTVSWAQEGGVA